MAFEIVKIKGAHVDVIAGAIQRQLDKSRFTADVRVSGKKVTIHDIRLRYSKDYCGNHPLPCPVLPFSRPHKKYKYLEGADWVGWNDMVNDILDDLGVSANVHSKLCVIRQAQNRCVEYLPQSRGFFNEWKKLGVYENHIGKKHPIAKFPAGTPGFPTYVGTPNYPPNHHH